jgi:GMP synthase (glutamine-hydrolysing)
MPQILVINFGSQVVHLITRRIRELGVSSEIKPFDVSYSEIKRIKPKGIILSGGPASVYEKNSPKVDKKIFSLGIPILGICYGLQLIGKYYGKVLPGKIKEYGKRQLSVKKNGKLLRGLGKKEQIWMSHGDLVSSLPKEFDVLADTETCKIAAVENVKDRIYGVQFHPEVAHTLKGFSILRNFVFNVCEAKKDWFIKDLKNKLIGEIKVKVKDDYVIMGVSGGVDSTVASFLINKAIKDRIYCVFVDHGLVRKDEAEEVNEIFKKFKFKHFYSIDASKIFLERLKGVADPEDKRKIIANTFIEIFDKKVLELERKNPKIKFLGQGTIYPDRIETAQPSKQADKIKSHHNVALPKKMKLKVIEPLQDFYKDEVRELGIELGIPKEVVFRHPFPGPGLAIRILGSVTKERLGILRESDYIFIEELKKSGYYPKTWQAFAALFPVKAVGVKGDARSYEYVIALRAVTSKDAMTADWARLPSGLLEMISSRILNEVKGVSRVLYDISQKPPATIEYE